MHQRVKSIGESRAAATSKMERFVIGTNGVQPLTIITKRFILHIAAALEPPLLKEQYPHKDVMNCLDFYMLKIFLFKVVC